MSEITKVAGVHVIIQFEDSYRLEHMFKITCTRGTVTVDFTFLRERVIFRFQASSEQKFLDQSIWHLTHLITSVKLPNVPKIVRINWLGSGSPDRWNLRWCHFSIPLQHLTFFLERLCRPNSLTDLHARLLKRKCLLEVLFLLNFVKGSTNPFFSCQNPIYLLNL